MPAARADATPGAGIESGPLARLSAAFHPDRLGAAAAVSFAVKIDPPGAGAPTALSTVEVGYPSDLGLATSGLGLQTCDPAALEREGAGVCPANSRMGGGSAVVEVPFGPEVVSETVTLSIFAAPSDDGYVHLTILAAGREPVQAGVVLSGVVLPGRLQIHVPLIVSVPGAPYVALARINASLGGALTYYERAHGHMRAYHPRGIGVPDRCPRHGWRVAATLVFADASTSRANTLIPCPARRTH